MNKRYFGVRHLDRMNPLNHLKMVHLDSMAILETKNSYRTSTYSCFPRMPVGDLAEKHIPGW